MACFGEDLYDFIDEDDTNKEVLPDINDSEDPINQRYGAEAGALTDNTLYAVGQTAMASHNVAALGIKGIAKRTAKDAGKALVHHYEDDKKTTKTNGVEIADEAMEVEGKDVPEGDDKQKKRPS